MRLRLLAVAGVALAALVAGCSGVVDGSGTLASGPLMPSGSASNGAPDFPSQSASAPGPGASTQVVPPPTTGGPSSGSAEEPTPCPQVRYPTAKLSFTCITTGMTAQSNGDPWPLSEYRTVEESTGWVLEEGAGHWGAPEGASLTAIAGYVREQMLQADDYGTSPKVTTDANRDTKVGGADAHLLQSTITLNTTWAKQRQTRVRQEKLWIVALVVGDEDVSLWYTSIPDLAKTLWPKVPGIIDTIRVL
jgi:hypothetical protein